VSILTVRLGAIGFLDTTQVEGSCKLINCSRLWIYARDFIYGGDLIYVALGSTHQPTGHYLQYRKMDDLTLIIILLEMGRNPLMGKSTINSYSRKAPFGGFS